MIEILGAFKLLRHLAWVCGCFEKEIDCSSGAEALVTRAYIQNENLLIFLQISSPVIDLTERRVAGIWCSSPNFDGVLRGGS
jgi:hypothetical protein